MINQPLVRLIGPNRLNYLSICLLGFVCLSLLVCFDAQAAGGKGKKKKSRNTPPQSQLVSEWDIYYADIALKGAKKKGKKKAKKKNKTQQVACNNTEPGVLKQEATGLQFTPYSENIRFINGKLKRNKKSASLRASLKRFKQLQKKGRSACINVPFNSLDRYKGEFGYNEAARLLRASGFGAPPAKVAHLLALGLDKAVDSLVAAPVPEPATLLAEMEELKCDTYFAGDEENEACNPEDENDLQFSGMRTAYYHWAMHTENQLQAKLMLYLNDHVAASFRVLPGCERYAARRHWDMLSSFAYNGDLISFLNQMVQDPLIVRWLNLYSSTKFLPNEDFGREFLELFTIGKVDLDGNPRYSDAEIIASSLAFTGYRSVNATINGTEDDYTSCYLAYSSDLHDPNPKVLWAGTPNETVVYDASDMVEAVKRHPGLAEFWAYNLIREFVQDKPSKHMVQQAADQLRKSNYNIKELLRVLFKSKAFYADESRGTLYKLPIEFALDALRTTGLPAPHPRWFLSNLDDLAQEMWDPPTVFGWYTYADNYLSSRYVLARRNFLMRLFNWGEEDLEEEGYDIFSQVLADEPSAEVLIDRFSRQLGVPINEAQKLALLEFMNYDVNWQGERVREVFDSVRGSDNAVEKTLGLWLLLMEQADFQRK